MTGKRLFVGIPLPNKLQKDIEVWRSDNFKYKNIRIIRKEDLHLTLIPPWNTVDEKYIIKKLNKINWKIFSVSFYKVTLGPSFKNPRLIWAEGYADDYLMDLIKEMEKVLGIKLNRKFRLHLTLARLKEKKFTENFSENVNWHFQVNEFCLYRSFLMAYGSVYKILFRFKSA